jgi:hypothetical protein
MTPSTVHDYQEQFDEIFVKARTGCPAAVQELFDKYAHLFLIVVRHQMSGKLRRLYDSDDFLQEVRTSLFEYLFEQHNFQTPAAFVAFVKRVAKNKSSRPGGNTSIGPNRILIGTNRWPHSP